MSALPDEIELEADRLARESISHPLEAGRRGAMHKLAALIAEHAPDDPVRDRQAAGAVGAIDFSDLESSAEYAAESIAVTRRHAHELRELGLEDEANALEADAERAAAQNRKFLIDSSEQLQAVNEQLDKIEHDRFVARVRGEARRNDDLITHYERLGWNRADAVFMATGKRPAPDPEAEKLAKPQE